MATTPDPGESGNKVELRLGAGSFVLKINDVEIQGVTGFELTAGVDNVPRMVVGFMLKEIELDEDDVNCVLEPDKVIRKEK